MLSKRRRSLRSKVKAFRKRKFKRMAVEELDDDIAALAVGQPKEGE